MTQPFRIARGGDIDRERIIRFRFNGRAYEGYPGDTLASALLANGVNFVARSFKYHRPRGVFGVGVEEPSALVQLGKGARTVPNLKATEIDLFDGLEASSVNVFPSLRFDLGSLIGALSPFMPASFYYKTFFGSPRLWHTVFEPLIRKAGGWGEAPSGPDPDFYDRRYAHCDVLVVGAGPAGLAAARAAAGGGARVIFVDENRHSAARLPLRGLGPGGASLASWAATAQQDLAGTAEVTTLEQTTITGYYDGNFLVGVQRLDHEGAASSAARVRQRLWRIRAKQVILATGAHERPLVFANNDRPGVMLASAVRAFIDRWAVLPGRRLVLFTNNDHAYDCAMAVLDAGGEVAAVVDARERPQGKRVEAARERGVDVMAGHVVYDLRGKRGVSAALVAPRTGTVAGRVRIDCDLLAVSGGYSPAIHLHSQAGGSLEYDEKACCFRPGSAQQACVSVGACNGVFEIGPAIGEGLAAGMQAALKAGYPAPETPAPTLLPDRSADPLQALWRVPHPQGDAAAKQFVDLHTDVSVADIMLAVREGFESVEHMKRYTLTGFGTEQGKTSNINALAILADCVGKPIPEVGTTTFRPPYTPVTFAAMGGRDRSQRFDPSRLTAMHDEHVALGAVFEDVGQWKRPRYYPRGDEDMQAAVARECAAVRESVGVLDASTLGKIDIQGPDSAAFLDRVYTNRWSTLKVGRIRYGVMCREDGMVFDDGTTSRLGESRFLMTTTTGNAAAVMDHLEEYLQTEWPELRVRLTSVTEQWSTVGIAGPGSRALLAEMAPDLELDPASFPFMSWQDAVVSGLPARVFRISFTGELQYEINVPWHLGPRLWRAVMESGEAFGATPYGTETMHVLRAEKGFIIVGQETDGTQTPTDLGLGWLVSEEKDFIGRRSLDRADTRRSGRPQLVGLMPLDPGQDVPEGTQLVETGTAQDEPPVPMVGYVTSSYWSAALQRHFCLALLKGGSGRHGDRVEAAVPGRAVPAEICNPVFYDPGGERRDG